MRKQLLKHELAEPLKNPFDSTNDISDYKNRPIHTLDERQKDEIDRTPRSRRGVTLLDDTYEASISAYRESTLIDHCRDETTLVYRLIAYEYKEGSTLCSGQTRYDITMISMVRAFRDAS